MSQPDKTTQDIPDEVVLAMMVDASRQEQAIGYPGWLRCDLDPRNAASIKRLAQRGLVQRDPKRREWAMPSAAGFAMIERHGHA